MGTFHKWAMFLVILGAANVGFSSFLHVDVVGMFGSLSSAINVLIGVSGIYMLLSTYTTLLKKA
jgi:uncharacterized membrane protein YuzA (DUF378 family)